MRVARYVRVSTEEQAKSGYSLENQVERLDAFCKAQGWMLAGEPYSDDSSGMSTEDRKGYKAMLDHMDDWDAAVAIKGDRFHRSIDNAQIFWRDMRRQGKQIWTVAEGRLDSPENASKWLSTMLTSGLLPEFESMQLSERVLPGMEKAKQKGFHQGRPPTGFIWVKELKKFLPTKWGQKVHGDALSFGLAEAARVNRWEEPSKMAGKPLNKATVWRIVRNFELYEAGQLLPNQRKTASGTWSKFAVKKDV